MAKQGTPPEMITPREVAARIGSSEDQVRREMREGIFPIGWADCPSGKKWVYHIVRAEFEALMAGKLPTNPDAMADKMALRLADQLVERLRDMRMAAADLVSGQPGGTTQTAAERRALSY